LFCALPLVDACSGPFLLRAIKTGDAAYLAFHATVIFTGVALAYAAVKVARRAKKAPAAVVVPVREMAHAEGGV
jgi:hypothetical protein